MSTALPQRRLHCPVCLARLSEPVALTCRYFFCKVCVDDMKANTSDSPVANEYECSICQTKTPIDEVTQMKVFQQLFEDVHSVAGKQQDCTRCKNQNPVHFCEDCNGRYCQECKDSHDTFPFMQSHSWVTNHGEEVDTANVSINCSTHSNKAVILNCKDCRQLVCTLCFKETHNEHRIVSIANATEALIPKVKEQLEKLKTLKEVTQNNLDTIISDAENLKKSYEDMEAEIDARYEELLRRLKEDKANVKKQLAQHRAYQTSDLGIMVTFLQRKSKWQDNVISLTETVLESKQITFKLSVLQEVLLNDLNTAINEPTKIIRYSKLPFTEIHTIDTDNKDMLGIVNTSMLSHDTVSGLAKANLRLSKEIANGFICDRFVKIGDELWCSEYSTSNIHIRSLGGEILGKINIPEVGECRAMILGPCGILLAATEGVFVIDLRGKIQHCLRKCEANDMSLVENKLHILDHSASNVSIMSYSCASKTYTKEFEFTLSEEYKKDDSDTIKATYSCIYIAQYEVKNILKYNSRGDLLDVILPCEAAIGGLQGPSLCGVDAKGGLLIADSCNNRILAYTSESAWLDLNIESIVQPEWVVCYDKQLIVLQYDGTLKFYTF